MITRIRDVRKAKALTLAEVAERCTPPTTAQTIGRLETGTRTVSVGWLNRIADALGVDAADLVQLPDTVDLPVAAILGAAGAVAPRQPLLATPPRPDAGALALIVEAGAGDYRAGDTVWLDRLAPDHFSQALNRDVLLPRPAGRFLFGRLIGRDPGKLHILPLSHGGRQQVIADPPWLGLATRLVRTLA
ncbi:helix-turn-helix domain-containing protein [Sphingomonas abietis]|uniref:Helix-turn-helix transcriptional regulator n=1 Tax=Sphingomonas abietis TaxID=3012344 RepID=A0ABY7NLI6_9SPHN|nr:helix-turn-helix transcriptional regulator [Sphingomonas abietis]WBO22097.1 helix-turn-helix transcriptional regulator [Sphingomonas abietis]